MVSASLRRSLSGATAAAAMLGWLQLAPAFGFPVTAPGGMLDRLFGGTREAGPVGWLLLLLGLAVIVVIHSVAFERWAGGAIGPIVFTIGVWLVVGAVVMPVLGLLQGATVAGAAPADPMRASFFMLDLGAGAAVEALAGWALFGAVLTAGVTLRVGVRAFSVALGAAALGAALAFAAPVLAAQGGSGRIVEGHVAALPAGPVFISVLELPQPAGAVLGPHRHVAGFVFDDSGVATMVAGSEVVDVGAGDAAFTGDQVPHDHENRAAVPPAIALSLTVLALTGALVVGRRRQAGVAFMAVLLVAGTIATVDPLMNDWYFIAVRPEAARGAPMPVPAGRRTYESDILSGLVPGPALERLTDRRLGSGESARFAGPAAIVVLDGRVSVITPGGGAELSARSGASIAGGSEAAIQSVSGAARILVIQVLPDH